MAVPRRNLIPKPASLTWAEAACLPTAWLTAYRMLFTRSGLLPGQTVLIQGAGGGVSTALIMLARQAGFRVWVTSRDEAKQARALELGAHQAFASGARLPEKVDVVMETVGAATWSHSLRSLRPGGRVVIAGATSGSQPPADLSRVFFLQLSVVGSTMGTRDELQRLVAMCEATGLRPLIDHELPLADAEAALAQVAAGDLFGKIVLIALTARAEPAVRRTPQRTRPHGRIRQITRPTMCCTAPNWRESVDDSGASPSTQKPSSSTRSTRLTISSPGRWGCSRTTTWPAPARPSPRARTQSPSCSVGTMDRPATAR